MTGAMHDDDREPPLLSRLTRSGGRTYRALTRAIPRDGHRYPRPRKQVRITELLGWVVKHHGLTDEARHQFVCLFWDEIAGERIAAKTYPVAFADSVLQVSAGSSSWVHEMQFHKTKLIVQINNWIDANRVWLGPPPLVTDIRCVLAQKHRAPIVEREQARTLRLQHAERTRPLAALTPPPSSEAERIAIQAETVVIDDPEVRALVESVRVKWNR
ncbi:MAG: DUF721 domain-containing protein [Kofleriaceae bacterium]|nr:DUF721 domain-containing protein [Kofleriaceae bacterium]